VKAVAAGDEVAAELAGRSARVAESDARRAVEPGESHAADLEEDLPTGGQARGDQIPQELVLRVKDDAASAGQRREIDAVGPAAEAQADAAVHRALAHHAVANARGRQEIHRPCSRTAARTVASMSARLRHSRTTESMPSAARRCESSRPAGPAPTMPTWVVLTRRPPRPGPRRPPGSRRSRRRAAIGSGLEQHFLDLGDGAAIPQRAAHMKAQLLLTVQGDQEGDGEQAPGRAREPRPGPDVAPDVPRDELLEVGGEGGLSGERAIDVRVAEHGAADGEPSSRSGRPW